MSDDNEDNARVALAQAIKAMEEHWASRMQLLAMQARLARARYEALVKAGFSEEQALTLCHRDLSL